MEEQEEEEKSLPPPSVMFRSVHPPPTPDLSGRPTEPGTDRPTDRPDGDKPPRAIRGPISSLSWRPAVSGLAGRRCAPSSLTSVPENNELVMFFIPSTPPGEKKCLWKPLSWKEVAGSMTRDEVQRERRSSRALRKGRGKACQSSIHPSVFLYGYKYTVYAICKTSFYSTSCLITKYI